MTWPRLHGGLGGGVRHGSSGGRPNPRNRLDARTLHQSGLAILLLDLLTTEELDRNKVFDIGLLAGRLMAVTR